MFSPDEIHPPPDIRTVLPALTNFQFMGSSMYLEDFVAHIDCPWLNQIAISYLIPLPNSNLRNSPGSSIARYPHSGTQKSALTQTLRCHLRPLSSYRMRRILAPCYDRHLMPADFKGLHLFNMLNNFSAILSTVVALKFAGEYWESDSIDDEYNLEWLHFLRQPSALQALYVSPPLAGKIGRALKSVKGEVVAEALPSLDLICLEDQASLIDKFVAVCQLSDFPLTVVSMEAEFD